MNFRQKAAPPPILGFQVTPMIDVFCCLLIFFIVTYNFSRAETSLEVKVPTAKEGKDNQRPINQCIINVASDGHVILNSQTLSQDQLEGKTTAALGNLSRSGRHRARRPARRVFAHR